MVEYILLASMAAVVLALLWLRTNTAICFLALCAGTVLLMMSGNNMSLIASSLTSGLSSSTNVIRIILLFAPMVVCAVILRNHLPKSKLPLAFIPAVATALLGAIFIAPELADGLEQTLANTETWKVLIQYQEAIVALGLVTSIVMIATTLKKPEEKHKKGHH